MKMSGYIRSLAIMGMGVVSLSFSEVSFTPIYGSFAISADDISGDGLVVVGYTRFSYYDEAFRWTASDGKTGLGELPGGNTFSHTAGCSIDANVVVGESPSANGNEAFRWTESGGMVGLGALNGSYFYSSAKGCSDDGSVVVGYSRVSYWDDEAFRWTQSSGMVGIGDLPGGSYDSGAYSVSGDGSTIVGDSYSSNGREAFRWTQSGGMVGLGDLPGGQFNSVALDCSLDGSVIVGTGRTDDGQEGFRWTQADGMVGLGDLPGGSFGSFCGAVSRDGFVIVGNSQSARGREAFVWDATNGMRSLMDILESNGIDLTGWSLTQAYAVSDNGRIITGEGTDPSGTAIAYVADIRDTIFGSGANEFEMQFVGIGHAGNGADTNTGYGAVDYEYRIGKYEVTIDQFTKADNADGSIGDGDENPFAIDVNGPASRTSWLEAAKFCNWLTSGSYNNGAYQFSDPNTLTGVDRITALTTYGRVYVLPTEDEWYKAAYFKNDASGYTSYSFGTNAPVAEVDANFGGTGGAYSSPWTVGTGTAENNGTFDMSGNVYELMEGAMDGLLDVLAEERVTRGLAYYSSTVPNNLDRGPLLPNVPDNLVGFRVLEITDPNLKSFGSGANAFEMQFVDIGHPGNVTNSDGYGAVGYNYKIAKHEVTIDQITKSGAGDGDENYWNDGTRTIGVDAPASQVSWYEAAQFCNWLTSGDTNSGAYQFDASGTLTNVDRKAAVALFGDVYVIPSEDEWYKAAYYKPVNDGSYSLYASGLDTAPALGTPSGWNYDFVNGSPNYTWEIGFGGQEQNGTYDMNGNVNEWNESAGDGTLDDMAENRVFRGGAYNGDESYLHSSYRNVAYVPTTEFSVFGFRVALISNSDEEPGAYVKWTVESPYGNPDPMVGTNLVEYGAWVTNSVEAVVVTNSSQYINLGSTEGGATNWFVRFATNNTDVIWEWATNYWVSAGTSGSGSVSIADGWYADGSNVAVSATPDPDWLFMGWSGDLSGDYTTSNQNLLVDAPRAFVATFSDDADGDGLSNSNETAIGTNPRLNDSDGDDFDDYFEVVNGYNPTNSHAAMVDFIRSNGGTFGLYETNVVLDVAVGQMALATTNGTADLSLQLMKSDDLVIWTNAAPPVNWSLPVDPEKQFFRVRAEP